MTQLTDLQRSGFSSHESKFMKPSTLAPLYQGCIYKFLAFNLLEGALQVNIQSGGLALARSTNPHHALDNQIIFCICLGIVTAVLNGGLAMQKVLQLRNDIKNVDLLAEIKAGVSGRAAGAIDGAAEFMATGDIDAVPELQLPDILNHPQAAMIISNLKEGAKMGHAGRRAQEGVDWWFGGFLILFGLYAVAVLRACVQVYTSV
jgi:hypothetical protein